MLQKPPPCSEPTLFALIDFPYTNVLELLLYSENCVSKYTVTFRIIKSAN
jgi:hypothetical protein